MHFEYCNQFKFIADLDKLRILSTQKVTPHNIRVYIYIYI